jgi:nucleotide-binding universal stress UspA family protein
MDTVPTKILVTLDGSPAAEAVLPYVLLLAARLRIPIELISVIDLTELARSAAAYESLFLDQLAEDETRRRREYLEKIAPSFANGQIDCRILKGNPESSIVEYAAQNPAAIIAMATHGRSGLNRWLLGSVAEKVLRSTSNPLLLIRSMPTAVTEQQVSIQSIMVPLDGSALAESVLPPVSKLAKKLYAEMVLFRAYNIPPGFYDAGGGFAIDLDRLLAQTEADVLTYLEEKKAALKKAGVGSVTIASRQGYDADEIINYAGNRPDRLIAMCSHGRSGVRRWAVGSVAETVVRHCSSPILVFRAPH